MNRFLLLLAPLALVALASCSKTKNTAGSHKYRLLWPKSNGSYSFQDVEIKTLENRHEVRGKNLKVYINPSYDGSNVEGDPPSAKFVKNSDGVFVPTNSYSHQMVAAYAHVEKLRALTKKSFPDFPKKSPSMILFHDNLKSGDKEILNNAFYYPEIDSIMIVPFKGSAKVPTSLNAGILGHEFFHSVFARYVPMWERSRALHVDRLGFDCMNKVPGSTYRDEDVDPLDEEVSFSIEDDDDPTPNEKELMNHLMMAAMNEGLADFWGFLYTRDPSFMGKSFPEDVRERSLKGQLLPGPNQAGLLRTVRRAKDLRPHRYRIGTQYARWMYQIYEVLRKSEGDSTARKIMMRHVIQLIDRVGQSWATTSSRSEVIPTSAFYDYVPDALTTDDNIDDACVLARLARLNENYPQKTGKWRAVCENGTVAKKRNSEGDQ